LFSICSLSALFHPQPKSIKEANLSQLHGRKIAIDASMQIYSFLIGIRQGGPNNAAAMLTNEKGEPTSHIQGLFNRAIRFLTEGIKPVFVFDGKPPDIKSGELVKRRERREKAQQALAEAKEGGNVEEQEKQEKRLVRVGTKENDECKRLLLLMGIPIVESPCEAEAQAAALCRSGEVWGVGTEDMDALTFACPILIRKMTFANASKSDVQQMEYGKAIEGLGLTHDQFVDLCILLGCDYCDSIKKVGPKTALKLIREHGSIEKILENINRDKYGVPDDWIPNEKKAKAEKEDGADEDDTDDEKDHTKKNDDNDEAEDNEEIEPIYVKARRLFNDHEVKTGLDLKWTECQPEPLTKFLVDEMCFNPDRVKAGIEKLQKAHKKNVKPQSRMDSFFKPVPGAGTKKKKPAAGAKRKGGAKDYGKGKKGFFGGKKR
jgi:flap endonuclease-1